MASGPEAAHSVSKYAQRAIEPGRYLQDRSAFSPKQLSILLWRFEKYRVPFDVRDFKLAIRRGREKVRLLNMVDRQIERLLPAMSASQRRFVAEARNPFG